METYSPEALEWEPKLNDRTILKKVANEGFLEYCMAMDDMDRGDVKRYEASWFHIELTNKLQEIYERVLKGEDVRVIIQCPPRHGKTRTSTILFPSWVLGKTPMPIMACSYSADLADKNGQHTRDVMTSDRYQAVFKAHLRDDMAAKGNWGTTDGGSYLATGTQGGITGKGFKIGIVDDPFKNRQEADSEVIRESVWSWFKSTFYTRQEGNTAIIIIATRWHVDDLIGKVLEQQAENEKAGLAPGTFDQWELISFPAIAEEDETFRKAGEALWPEKFPLSKLNAIKNSSNDLYEWSALYQQSPILSENAEFSKQWFKYYDDEKEIPKDAQFTTTVDLAISQKQTADNSVIRTVAKSPRFPQWYLCEETAGKMDPLQVIDAIFYHHNKYRSRVWIESVAYQKALSYFVIEEMRKRQTYFEINELKRSSTTSKETRIRGLIPLYKAGVILHRRNHDSKLELEQLSFPKGKHDDRVDCLAMQLEVIRHTRIPEEAQEEKQAFDKFKSISVI